MTLARDIPSVGAAAWPSASAFVISCVPSISSRTLAVCRILVGGLLLFFWLQYEPGELARLAHARRPLPFTDLVNVGGWLSAWSASATGRSVLYWSVVALAALLGAGAFTRIVAPLLALSLWLAAMLMQWGHFATPLLWGMTATAFAPWSDARSVDAALRRDRAPDVASPLYGYAPWLLGLCIALAYAAAGLSKLWLTKGAWLWETGARNGFIQDLGPALTDMGMHVSNSYWLALGASVFSSFGQIAYLFASFNRSWRVKYAVFLFVALPFLIGLILTMGLFWWPWGLLILILYMPWRQIDRSKSRSADFPKTPSGQRHRMALLVWTALLVVLHAYAVVAAREFEPLYSNYPMYADRMLAGSEYEKEMVGRWTRANRNGRYTVSLVLNDGTERDVNDRHRYAWFIWGARLYVSPYARLRIEKDACRAALSIDPATVAVRHGLRRFEIDNGKLQWSATPGDSTTIRCR